MRRTGRVRQAWFSLLDEGRQLALLAVAERDPARGFEPLALQLADGLGDLFDRLFEHLEGAPPVPVCAHRAAFAAHLLAPQRSQSPVGGYAFDACPGMDVTVTRDAVALWRSRLEEPAGVAMTSFQGSPA